MVSTELRAQATWSTTPTRLFHYRSLSRQEVDFVLESSLGSLVAIEVKARATIKASDFRAIHRLQAAVGPRFHRGIVLHTGRNVISFAENLHAIPVSALWQEC